MAANVSISIQVFSHVHPIDLFALVRTTKYLRKLLLSKGSLSVWDSAFALHRDVPPVPDTISHPKWTTMLFGPPRCDGCSVYPALVDFSFNERLYDSCINELFFSYEDAVFSLDGVFPDPLSYVLGTQKSDALYYPKSYFWTPEYNYEQLFRKADIEDFKAQVNLYRADIRGGVPNGQVMFDQFLTARRKFCAEKWKIAEAASMWARDAYNDCAVLDTSRWAIIERWKEYLMSLGHTSTDIAACDQDIHNFIKYNYIFSKSKKEFNKWRKQLERMVNDEMRVRLCRNTTTFYLTVVQPTFHPSLWSSLPPTSLILTHEPVQDHIALAQFGKFSWTDVAESINDFVNRWVTYSKTPMLKALELAGYNIAEGDLRSTINIAAMSVLICHNQLHQGLQRRALIGWESIVRHLGCLFDKSGACTFQSSLLSFSTIGHDIISTLVSSLNKDPTTVTVSDMDNDDRIFICGDCDLIRVGDDLGSYFYTWRQAVEHGVIENPGHTRFIPVSEEVKKGLVKRKPSFPDTSEAAWACNHCLQYRREPTKRATVIKHLNREYDSMPHNTTSEDRRRYVVFRRLDAAAAALSFTGAFGLLYLLAVYTNPVQTVD
ncbi:hypothetical protein CVT24_005035 [Panaeolus cyanescens]|uniref:F-box domain-containing protein n=1 Tax=Panaeolus cyanescens TaxID=181874 RepID=A0A409YBB3_9AGAR|nr:hypothetical protein CVT24_005035 [Panaeolus cyanescens]